MPKRKDKKFLSKKRDSKKLTGVKKKSAKKKAVSGAIRARAKATGTCPLAGGGLAVLSQRYADLVCAGKPWTWNDVSPGLTRSQQQKIRREARSQDLVPVVPRDPKQNYVKPKPKAPFVIFPKKYIKDEQTLPKSKWLESDAVQFKILNDDLAKRDKNYNPKTQTFKGSPKKYTWHHAQDPPGTMQLVDFGAHNSTNHSGGRNVWGGGTEHR